MAYEIINENTTSYLTIMFKNKAGDLAAPNSSEYRIDCLATDTELKDWTNLGVSSSVEITISASTNSIQNELNQYEDKQVTVKATYGDDDEVTNTYTYTVKNLNQIPPFEPS